jgi:lipopolysaccharide/colanic/teichoic acid biosynthesis glycosyltransferase
LDLLLVLLVAPLAIVFGGLIAIAVFVDSPGPILYRSSRIGRGGRRFAMLKFRTMVRDSSGPPVSARGDERYTPLGRTLASSRLDELPQLLNVLRGDMRLVGPRPEVEDFVREFPKEYERILSVPPGLTGPAQVEYAWEGDMLARAKAVDRARVYRESILPLKLAIDLQYVARHNVRGDLVLLARTALLPLVRTWRQLDALLGAGGIASRSLRLASVALVFVALIALAALLAVESAQS